MVPLWRPVPATITVPSGYMKFPTDEKVATAGGVAFLNWNHVADTSHRVAFDERVLMVGGLAVGNGHCDDREGANEGCGRC